MNIANTFIRQTSSPKLDRLQNVFLIEYKSWSEILTCALRFVVPSWEILPEGHIQKHHRSKAQHGPNRGIIRFFPGL